MRAPPMGAKTMPIMKKRGRTLFGVKIGLTGSGQTVSDRSRSGLRRQRSELTAMLSIVAGEKQYLIEQGMGVSLEGIRRE